MTKNEFTFPSRDGKTSLHAVEWLPAGTPRGVVQLSHGVAEYVDRPVVKKLVRTVYVRNPLEYAAVGIVCFVVGILFGFLL